MNVTQDLTTMASNAFNVTAGLGTSNEDQLPLHCTRGSLTSSYGWIVQGILASVAFTCLIGEILISTLRSLTSHLNSETIL